MVKVFGSFNTEAIKQTAQQILKEIIMKEEVERNRRDMEASWLV